MASRGKAQSLCGKLIESVKRDSGFEQHVRLQGKLEQIRQQTSSAQCFPKQLVSCWGVLLRD
jgi:hypothetical protein